MPNIIYNTYNLSKFNSILHKIFVSVGISI